jgi:PKD repeat protein
MIRAFLAGLLFLPFLLSAQSITPQLSSYDGSTVTLTWSAVPGATAYNVYRLPFEAKRRDVKPRLYDRAFVYEDPSAAVVYTDYYPFDLTLRAEQQVEYLVTAEGPDGVSETPFSSAYASRLALVRPQADFAISAEAYCPLKPVHFTDDSSGLVAGHQWAVGEDVFGSEPQAVRSFAEAGNYEIWYEVSGPIGKAAVWKTVTIHPTPQPQILGEHEACESTQLTTQSDQTGYQWYFNDQAVSGAVGPTLLIQEPGNYVVSFVDGHSCFGKSEEFTFNHYPQPLGAFVPEPAESPAGELINFLQGSEGERLSYRWDFGDGSGSSEAQPAHAYRRPGAYTITLAVADRCGRSVSIQATVTITPGAFSLSGDIGTCMGGTVLKLTGEGFPASPGVFIDGQPCELLSSSPREIQVITPAHPGGLAYYDVEVRDPANLVVASMRQAFRYVTLAFAAIAAGNAVATVDMEARIPFAWPDSNLPNPSHLPIQMAGPQALVTKGNLLWVGGQGGLCKFNSGTGTVEASYSTPPTSQVTAIAVSDGLHGRYLFAGIVDAAADPRGSVLILEAETLVPLAAAPFDGALDGKALDLQTHEGKVYLLARGPLSQSDNKQHKKAMVLTVYDPLRDFQIIDGVATLNPEASKNKGTPTPDDVGLAGLAFDDANGRLFYPDAPNLGLYELTTDPLAFKGPDIGTSERTSALLSLAATGEPMLWALKPTAGVLDVFALPANGPKPLIATIPLGAAGCASPYAMVSWGDNVVISCASSQRLVLFAPATFDLNGEVILGPGDNPTSLAVQPCAEVGR